jgi:hypothetical protein
MWTFRNWVIVWVATFTTVFGGPLIHAAFSSAPRSPIFVSAGAISKVAVVTDVDQQEIQGNTGWVDLQGASLKFSVSLKWLSALTLARFEGSPGCFGGDFCLVRILVDGQEANPVGDSSNWLGGDTSIDRWLTVGPGKHRVQVQWNEGPGGSFTMSHWSLTLEVARQS